MEQYREDVRRLMLAVNHIEGVYGLVAKRIGLKENTLSLLYALDDGEAHTQTQICEAWLIPKTTINTVVKECIEAGYVTLEAGEHLREKLIRLTQGGRDYARGVLKQVYAIENRAMEKTAKEFSPGFAMAIEKFSEHLRLEAEGYFKESNEYE